MIYTPGVIPVLVLWSYIEEIPCPHGRFNDQEAASLEKTGDKWDSRKGSMGRAR